MAVGLLLYLFLCVAGAIFVWLLRAERKLSYKIMRETDFRAVRIRFYLSAAGIIWMLCVPTGLVLYVVGELVPTLGSNGELSLTISLLVVSLVVPQLILRSALLAEHYRE